MMERGTRIMDRAQRRLALLDARYQRAFDFQDVC
jgi:hypothetical protein